MNTLAIIFIVVWYIALVFSLVYSYDLYWRDAGNLRNKLIARAEKLPRWLPFRQAYISYIQSRGYVDIKLGRFVTIIGTIFAVGLLIIGILIFFHNLGL